VETSGLGDGAFDIDVIELSVIVSMLPLLSKLVLEPPVIVRTVPWVGKLSVCYSGSRICNGGDRGGLVMLVCIAGHWVDNLWN
jgi:hypothetical protein